MRAIANDIQTQILKEQFIPDHVFLYVVKGAIHFFDGNKSYALKSGECCIARKNSLAKFILPDSEENFEPILFCFDEEFLRQFQTKHKTKPATNKNSATFIKLEKYEWIDTFIRSIKPYHKGIMQLDEAFEDIKYEELLLILLTKQPELAGIFFDYAKPEKINLEAFMNRSFTFNVGLRRFAYLTGRSLSAFKRDFKEIFNETPNRWLVQKRLEEAYFLIDKKNKKPSDIYLDLGFETLSHFSFAFKRRFNLTPSKLTEQKKSLHL